jgi:hypothetical protein
VAVGVGAGLGWLVGVRASVGGLVGVAADGPGVGLAGGAGVAAPPQAASHKLKQMNMLNGV